MMEHTLKVEALANGTVIDHIPAGQGRRILKLFRMSESGERIYIGFNLPSRRTGKKDLIKVENITFTPAQANQLALFAPNATVNVIEDFKVVRKFSLRLPETIAGVFTCPNSNCASHGEPVKSRFYVRQHQGQTRLKCHYCEKTFPREIVSEA